MFLQCRLGRPGKFGWVFAVEWRRLNSLVERDLARRWRATIGHVQDGAERVQATADALTPELSPGAEPNLRGLIARHTGALFDHTVALNCLHALIADHIGVRSSG